MTQSTDRNQDIATDVEKYSAQKRGRPEPTDNTPWRRPLLMKRLYLKEEKTQEEIADELGCVKSTVSKWLQKHGIETRVAGGGRGVNYARLRHTRPGYVRWRVSGSEKQESAGVMVHRLLAVAEFGFDAVAGMHVHHTNGIPWDNRPDNIELMEPGEHARHHNEGSGVAVDTILMELRAGAEALGRRLCLRDIRLYSEYSMNLIYKHFENLDDAQEQAGVDPETGEIVKSLDSVLGQDGDEQ